MTEGEAKSIAVAFMESQTEIAPWSFSTIKFMPISEFVGKPRWTVIFDNEDPEWKDHVCFIVHVDEATRVASFFETL